jgi:hypothetical protein
MAKYVAAGQIRGLFPPKDGVEHVLEAGGEVTLDAGHPETVRLVAMGALAVKAEPKPADGKKPTDGKKPD